MYDHICISQPSVGSECLAIIGKADSQHGPLQMRYYKVGNGIGLLRRTTGNSKALNNLKFAMTNKTVFVGITFSGS